MHVFTDYAWLVAAMLLLALATLWLLLQLCSCCSPAYTASSLIAHANGLGKFYYYFLTFSANVWLYHMNLHECVVPSILHEKLLAFPTLMNSTDPPCGIGLVAVLTIFRLQKYLS